MDRVEIARVYKIRSDESFEVAQRCLVEENNRVSITRSYYAVMQMITAATYLKLLKKQPPGDQPNWHHGVQGALFQELASTHTGVPRELFNEEAEEIRDLYKRRLQADYKVQADNEMTNDCAAKCFAFAQRIREQISEYVGDCP